MFKIQWERSMRARLLIVTLGFVTACTASSLAAQEGERVLIRNGFVVPAGRLLLVDDMSVDCVIASEVFDQQEFSKAGVATTAYLRISYPDDACPEALDSESGCPLQDYAVGTASARGLRALFIQPGEPNRLVLRAAAGRQMHVFAGAGTTLRGVCAGAGVNILNGFINAGSGRLVAPTPP
jgi:hypothetical protein